MNHRERWRAAGLSPFFTDRARARAPQILSYAAVGGAALLIAPNGELVMMSGAVAGVDLERLARLARSGSGGGGVGVAGSARRSFKIGAACVHITPITAGWSLCAITIGIEPGVILERLRRASSVMAHALIDGSQGPDGRGGGGSPPSGSAAEVFAAIPIPTRRAN